MFRRINRKKYRVFATDFETHNDEESIAKQETSIWLACLIDETSTLEDDSIFSYSMEEYVDKLEALVSIKRGKHNGKNDKRIPKNVCIYDYNLSFEWSFILPELLKRGFKFKETIEKDDEYVFNTVSTKTVSSVWQIMLKFGKHSGTILFRDLAKIYGGGLGKVAQSFGLETQKGEIDYRKNRLHNYTITNEEKEYCFKDVKILMEILVIMNNRDDKDFWNSCSMASYSMRRMLKSCFPRSVKPYRKFRELYPELDDKETEFLRNTVGGGITYAPRKWQFVDIKQRIGHIDAHQMHPTQMYSKPFPYGYGEYFEGQPKALFKHINACHIRISYDDVKLHSIISLIGIEMISDRELWVWDFEIPTMKKCYVNLEIEYIDGYSYKCKFAPFRNYVADNYKDRLIAKKNKDPFGTLFYKLLNNSSYGKFLEKPHNLIFANTIDELGMINSDILEKDEEDIRVNAKYTYLPVGSCIPAYSRVCLIETALLFGWENVVYFDTDSIFFIWNKQTKKVYESLDLEDHLGGWDLEEVLTRAQFSAPKRYKTIDEEGHTTIKAGGINFNKYKEEKVNEELEITGETVDDDTKKALIEKYMIPYEEINIISSKWKVQRAYRVKGGTIIEFQDKEMKVPKKYLDIYNTNVIMKAS